MKPDPLFIYLSSAITCGTIGAIKARSNGIRGPQLTKAFKEGAISGTIVAVSMLTIALFEELFECFTNEKALTSSDHCNIDPINKAVILAPGALLIIYYLFNQMRSQPHQTSMLGLPITPKRH